MNDLVNDFVANYERHEQNIDTYEVVDVGEPDDDAEPDE